MGEWAKRVEKKIMRGLTLSTSIQKTTNDVVERAARMVENASVVALDLETTGLDPRTADIRLVQVSDGEKIFVLDAFRRDVRPVARALAREDLTVLAHGGDFEWRFLYHHFGLALDNIVDTMLLSRLAFCGDMSEGVGLGDMAESELEIKLDKDMQKADWTVDPLPRRQLDYAAMDVKVLPSLYELLSGVIEDTGQERVAEIENGALPGADCLAMLHVAGYEDLTGTTAKDLAAVEGELIDALLAYRKAKGDDRERLKERVLELAPEKPPAPAPPWNFGSPQQVSGISRIVSGEELPDTEVGTLLRHKGEHPFFEHLLTYRKIKKLVSTYGTKWFKQAYHDGRVYPAWWQIGTSTGRVASGSKNEAPNAQNIPGAYRKFFVAPEGRAFVDADYSQIEVRILAKMLNEERLLKIYGRPEDEAESGDVYRATAAYMLGVNVGDVTKPQRNLAKAIVLGMNYGLSAYGLPAYAFKNLEIEDMGVEEAEEHVAAFYDLYPKIHEYHDGVLAELNELGSVEQATLSGRLRSEIRARNEAINAPVQGTSADILKRAMALVYHRLKTYPDAFVIASIHDELLVECNEGDAEAVKDIVEGAMLEAADEIVNSGEPRVKIEVEATISKGWAKG